MKILLPVVCLGIPLGFALGYSFAPPATGSAGAGRKVLFDSKSSSAAQAAQAVKMLEEIRTASNPVTGRRSLLDLVENADAGELERLFSAARLSDDVSARNAAAQRWAEVDPAGFYSHLKTLRPDEMEELNEVATILFRTWAHRDPEKSFAEAKKAESLPGFSGVRGAVVSGLLEDNPEKGFAMMATEKNYWMISNPIKKSVWEKDPARFAKAAAVLGEQNFWYGNVSGPYSDAISAWAAKDFAGSLEWAKSLKKEMRAFVMPKLLGKLAETDPAQALSIFASLEPSPEREAAGPALVSQWAKKDPQAALDWIEETMTGGRGQAYTAWISAIADGGLDKAAELLQSLPEGNGRDQAVRGLAMKWAEKDTAGAVNWIKAMPEESDRRDAYGYVLGRWAMKDQNGYKNFIATAPMGELPENYPYYFTSGDREAQGKQVTWAAALPEDRRDKIFESVFHTAAWNRKPAEIMELLNEAPDQKLRATVAAQTVGNLIQEDATRAQELLGLLPAGTLSAERRGEFRKSVEKSGNLPDAVKQGLLQKLQ
ncbi:MAG: hypothetical protein V4726_22820 [Verrucomicrobiota bacterium]